MKLATYCGLLLLGATTALAQSPPKPKNSHRAGGRQRQFSPRMPTQVPATASPKDHYCHIGEIERLQEVAETQQVQQADPAPVYVYVEQMPMLNGRPGPAPITAVIRQHLVLPPAAPTGRTFVQFVVSTEGDVTQPQIVKGLRADVDSAVLGATRQLPRLTPGKQQGRVVAVRLTLAVPIGEP